MPENKDHRLTPPLAATLVAKVSKRTKELSNSTGEIPVSQSLSFPTSDHLCTAELYARQSGRQLKRMSDDDDCDDDDDMEDDEEDDDNEIDGTSVDPMHQYKFEDKESYQGHERISAPYAGTTGYHLKKRICHIETPGSSNDILFKNNEDQIDDRQKLDRFLELMKLPSLTWGELQSSVSKKPEHVRNTERPSGKEDKGACEHLVTSHHGNQVRFKMVCKPFNEDKEAEAKFRQEMEKAEARQKEKREAEEERMRIRKAKEEQRQRELEERAKIEAEEKTMLEKEKGQRKGAVEKEEQLRKENDEDILRRKRKESDQKERMDSSAREKREAKDRAQREAQDKAMKIRDERQRQEAKAREQTDADVRVKREAEEKAKQDTQERSGKEPKENIQQKTTEKSRIEKKDDVRKSSEEKITKGFEKKDRQLKEENEKKGAEEKAKRDAHQRDIKEDKQRSETEGEEHGKTAKEKNRDHEREESIRKRAAEKSRTEEEAKARKGGEDIAKKKRDEDNRKENKDYSREETFEKARKETEEKLKKEREEKQKKDQENKSSKVYKDADGKGGNDKTRTDVDDKRQTQSDEKANKQEEERRQTEAEKYAKKEKDEKARKEAMESKRRATEAKQNAKKQIEKEQEEKARKDAFETLKRQKENANKDSEEKARKITQESRKRESTDKIKTDAEEKVRKESIRKDKKEKEEKAKQEAEDKRKKAGEEKYQKDTEEKAAKESEEKAGKRFADKEKKEKEEKARQVAEAKSRKEAEEKVKQESAEKAQKDTNEKYKKENERKPADEKSRNEGDEKSRREAEDKSRKESAEKANKHVEEKIKKENEEKSRKEAEEKVRKESTEKDKKDKEGKSKNEAEEKAKKAADEKSKEAEDKARKQSAETAKKAADEKTKQAAEEKARKIAEEKSRKGAEEKSRKESTEKDRKEKEEKAKQEAEEKVKKAAEEKFHKESEEKLRKETEDKLRKESAEKAKKDKEEKAKKAAEEKSRNEAEEKLRKESLEREKKEKEKKAKNQAEDKAKKAAEEKSRKEAEDKARKEAAEKAKKQEEEKTLKANEEKAKKQEEEKTRKATEEKSRKDAEEKARKESTERAKKEQEEKIKIEAQEKAKRQEEEKARKAVEEKSRKEADEKSRKDSVEKARKESAEKDKEENAKREAEEKAKKAAREKSQKEAEEKAKKQEEGKARKEAEEKFRKEFAETAKKQEEEKAKQESESKLRKESAEKAKKEEQQEKARKAVEKQEAEEKARKQYAENGKEEEGEKTKKETQEKTKKQKLEQAKKAAEEKSRKEVEEKDKKEKELKAKKEAEEKAKIAAEEKSQREAEKKARQEAEERERKESAEKAKKEDEEKSRKVAEERSRKEAEEKARKDSIDRDKSEKEEKAKKQAQENVKKAAEEKFRKEADGKLNRDYAEKAKKEEDEKARKVAEEKSRKEAEQKARKESADKAKREEEERASKVSEDKARKVAEGKAISESAQKAKKKEEEENARKMFAEKTKKEEDAKAIKESEAKAKKAADEKSRKEAEEKAIQQSAEKARKEEEEQAQKEAEERARQATGEKSLKDAVEKAKKKSAENSKKEKEEKSRKETEEKAREAAEGKSRKEAEEKARKESAEKDKREKEEMTRKEAEDKAKKAADEKALKDAKENTRKEAEEKARKESAEKAKREKEEKTKQEAEEKAKKAADEKSRKEAEEIIRKEAEEKLRKDSAEKAKKEEEEKSKKGAEEKSRKASEQTSLKEAEEKARKEAEEKSRIETAEKVKKEAEEQARKETAEKAKKEKEDNARKAAEEKSRKEAEEKAKRESDENMKKEKDEKTRKETEEKVKKAAEEKFQKESGEKSRKDAEEKSRKETEEKSRKEAEEKARKQSAERAKKEAEENLKQEAAEKLKKEEEEKARKEAEENTKKEAEEKSRKESAEKSKKEAEEKARNVAEEKSRKEEEKAARKAAENKSRKEDEENARKAAEENSHKEAEKSRKDAEVRERNEAEEKARKESAEKAKKEKEETLKREAEEKVKKETAERAEMSTKEKSRSDVEEKTMNVKEGKSGIKTEKGKNDLAEKDKAKSSEKAKKEADETARTMARKDSADQGTKEATENARREAKEKANRLARERHEARINALKSGLRELQMYTTAGFTGVVQSVVEQLEKIKEMNEKNTYPSARGFYHPPQAYPIYYTRRDKERVLAFLNSTLLYLRKSKEEESDVEEEDTDENELLEETERQHDVEEEQGFEEEKSVKAEKKVMDIRTLTDEEWHDIMNAFESRRRLDDTDEHHGSVSILRSSIRQKPQNDIQDFAMDRKEMKLDKVFENPTPNAEISPEISKSPVTFKEGNKMKEVTGHLSASPDQQSIPGASTNTERQDMLASQSITENSFLAVLMSILEKQINKATAFPTPTKQMTVHEKQKQSDSIEESDGLTSGSSVDPVHDQTKESRTSRPNNDIVLGNTVGNSLFHIIFERSEFSEEKHQQIPLQTDIIETPPESFENQKMPLKSVSSENVQQLTESKPEATIQSKLPQKSADVSTINPKQNLANTPQVTSYPGNEKNTSVTETIQGLTKQPEPNNQTTSEKMLITTELSFKRGESSKTEHSQTPLQNSLIKGGANASAKAGIQEEIISSGNAHEVHKVNKHSKRPDKYANGSSVDPPLRSAVRNQAQSVEQTQHPESSSKRLLEKTPSLLHVISERIDSSKDAFLQPYAPNDAPKENKNDDKLQDMISSGNGQIFTKPRNIPGDIKQSKPIDDPIGDATTHPIQQPAVQMQAIVLPLQKENMSSGPAVKANENEGMSHDKTFSGNLQSPTKFKNNYFTDTQQSPSSNRHSLLDDAAKPRESHDLTRSGQMLEDKMLPESPEENIGDIVAAREWINEQMLMKEGHVYNKQLIAENGRHGKVIYETDTPRPTDITKQLQNNGKKELLENDAQVQAKDLNTEDATMKTEVYQRQTNASEESICPETYPDKPKTHLDMSNRDKAILKKDKTRPVTCFNFGKSAKSKVRSRNMFTKQMTFDNILSWEMETKEPDEKPSMRCNLFSSFHNLSEKENCVKEMDSCNNFFQELSSITKSAITIDDLIKPSEFDTSPVETNPKAVTLDDALTEAIGDNNSKPSRYDVLGAKILSSGKKSKKITLDSILNGDCYQNIHHKRLHRNCCSQQINNRKTGSRLPTKKDLEIRPEDIENESHNAWDIMGVNRETYNFESVLHPCVGCNYDDDDDPHVAEFKSDLKPASPTEEMKFFNKIKPKQRMNIDAILKADSKVPQNTRINTVCGTKKNKTFSIGSGDCSLLENYDVGKRTYPKRGCTYQLPRQDLHQENKCQLTESEEKLCELLNSANTETFDKEKCDAEMEFFNRIKPKLKLKNEEIMTAPFQSIVKNCELTLDMCLSNNNARTHRFQKRYVRKIFKQSNACISKPKRKVKYRVKVIESNKKKTVMNSQPLVNLRRDVPSPFRRANVIHVIPTDDNCTKKNESSSSKRIEGNEMCSKQTPNLYQPHRANISSFNSPNKCQNAQDNKTPCLIEDDEEFLASIKSKPKITIEEILGECSKSITCPIKTQAPTGQMRRQIYKQFWEKHCFKKCKPKSDVSQYCEGETDLLHEYTFDPSCGKDKYMEKIEMESKFLESIKPKTKIKIEDVIPTETFVSEAKEIIVKQNPYSNFKCNECNCDDVNAEHIKNQSNFFESIKPKLKIKIGQVLKPSCTKTDRSTIVDKECSKICDMKNDEEVNDDEKTVGEASMAECCSNDKQTDNRDKSLNISKEMKFFESIKPKCKINIENILPKKPVIHSVVEICGNPFVDTNDDKEKLTSVNNEEFLKSIKPKSKITIDSIISNTPCNETDKRADGGEKEKLREKCKDYWINRSSKKGRPLKNVYRHPYQLQDDECEALLNEGCTLPSDSEPEQYNVFTASNEKFLESIRPQTSIKLKDVIPSSKRQHFIRERKPSFDYWDRSSCVEEFGKKEPVIDDLVFETKEDDETNHNIGYSPFESQRTWATLLANPTSTHPSYHQATQKDRESSRSKPSGNSWRSSWDLISVDEDPDIGLKKTTCLQPGVFVHEQTFIKRFDEAQRPDSSRLDLPPQVEALLHSATGKHDSDKPLGTFRRATFASFT